MHILAHQYDLIKERRETLFRYCETISPGHFTFKHDAFGGGSIQHLLVHIANTYTFWLGHFTTIAAEPFAKPDMALHEIRLLYKSVDSIAENFLSRFDPTLEEPITNKISGRDMEVAITPLQLFTHVITHEYHHKGQILSMSRQLGYTPIDTDIIRFE
ncbi:MAG TPA: DinB family protein [Chryseosolibacter sp.]